MSSQWSIVFICFWEPKYWIRWLLKMNKWLSSRGAMRPGGKYGTSLWCDTSPEATSDAVHLSTCGGRKSYCCNDCVSFIKSPVIGWYEIHFLLWPFLLEHIKIAIFFHRELSAKSVHVLSICYYHMTKRRKNRVDNCGTWSDIKVKNRMKSECFDLTLWCSWALLSATCCSCFLRYVH